jgi:hypothetical protein
MTQPDFVPISISVAKFYREAVPLPEIARPAEPKGRRRAVGRLKGSPGPDQGYVLRLIEDVIDKVVIGQRESLSNVKTALQLVASKRASLFGRAPMKSDVDFSVELLRLSEVADDTFVEVRRVLLSGVAHDYIAQRTLSDLFPDELLKLSLAELKEHAEIWDEWIDDQAPLSA